MSSRPGRRHKNLDAPAVRNADGKTIKEYNAWAGMVARITQPSPSTKARYHGSVYSGLKIEPAWLGSDGFAQFYKDVGPAPLGNCSLDRKNNKEGYFKENVRWASAQQQNSNKSNVRMIEAFGITKTLQEWSDELGVSSTAIRSRIDILGWNSEDAISRRPQGPRPTNDVYYLQIAGRVALRSTCGRRAVGCVLVDNNNYVLSTGYNSSPSGSIHCFEQPCEAAKMPSGTGLNLCQSRHAEDVALMKCRNIHEISKCYTTVSPCVSCVSRLIDTSCQEIIFSEEYPDAEDAKRLWVSRKRNWKIIDA